MPREYSALNDLRLGEVLPGQNAAHPQSSFFTKAQPIGANLANPGTVLFTDFLAPGLWNHSIYGAIISDYTAALSDFFIGELVFFLSEKPIVRLPVQYANDLVPQVLQFPSGTVVSCLSASTAGMADSLFLSLPALSLRLNLSPFNLKGSFDRVQLISNKANPQLNMLAYLAIKSTNVT